VLHVAEAYAPGLRDLDGFSHVIFATRSPKRPNPIGISIFRLVRIAGPDIHVLDVDAVDGSPILDIKPYVPAFDAVPAASSGWFAGKLGAVASARADARFSEP